MIYHSDIEEEVDAIRDRLYSTIKDMTSGERVEYINSRAREIMMKHGIAVSNSLVTSDARNVEQKTL